MTPTPMPIKPQLRHYYSRAAGWPLIRERILARAQRRCEFCGVPDGGRVVLTIAHLDQNPANNAEANLRALCQRCHLNHDRPFNVPKQHLTRARRKDAARPLLAALAEEARR
jgi:5-methylcytosine-specific restriction endonuclease McrA